MQCSAGSSEVANTTSPTGATERDTGNPVEYFHCLLPVVSCPAKTSPARDATKISGFLYAGGAKISLPVSNRNRMPGSSLFPTYKLPVSLVHTTLSGVTRGAIIVRPLDW